MTQNLSRRRFISHSTGCGAATILSSWTPWWQQAARGAETQGCDKILVMIQLAGGNDGLNTVVPYADDVYRRSRPALALNAKSILKLNDRLGLHPALNGLRELWDEGRLAIIEGVGYPQPNRSHFRSMDIWHAAILDEESPDSGWLGRSLDHARQMNNSLAEFTAVGTDRPPLAGTGRLTVPICIQQHDQFQLKTPADSGVNDPLWRTAASRAATGPLGFLRQSATAAVSAAHQFSVLNFRRAEGTYPGTKLAGQLQLIAQMIAAGLPTRVYLVSLDGFDTHANQLAGHGALLRELSDAVTAFSRNLQDLKCDDRVLITSFSEFGRRVAENGSLGTDHGAASVMFAVMPKGTGGIYGKPPSLIDLDDGDLKFTTDFRQVYATILERWLELPSVSILKGQFAPLDFLG